MLNNKMKVNKNLKLYVWDLETSQLNANFGFIIAACVKDVNTGKVWTWRIDKTTPWIKGRRWDDKHVVRELAKKLSEADMWITHYGALKKFDLPFLNTRMLAHGLKPLPNIPMLDTHSVARGTFRFHSNRLQTYLDLLGKAPKTFLNGSIWTRAVGGHKPSIDYIVKHCIRDVDALAEVYEEIRPYIRNHPSLAAVSEASDACPSCGVSGHLQQRGWSYARATKKQRYQCTNCSSWSYGRPMAMKMEAR